MYEVHLAVHSWDMATAKQQRSRELPKGPRGEKRPADVIGAAVRVARISVGDEVEDDLTQPSVKEVRQRAGKLGGPSRAKSLTQEEREKIARMGANARWKKS
jgi:hypothetical protein